MTAWGEAHFRAMVEMRIEPGREAEFECVWLEVAARIAAETANLGQWLTRRVADSRDADDPTYIVFTDWADESSFREFERSAAHLRHRARLAPYRRGGHMITTAVVYRISAAGVNCDE